MASREKRPLAPSKSKQKANNDSSSLASAAENSRNQSSSSKKSKSLTHSRSQLAREIFEAVKTGSQLPAKLEASLPRKRALQTALKRKQKAKKTLIKVKQKVPIKTLKRIADAKKILNKKKKKVKQQHSVDTSLDNSTESEDSKNKCKTAKKSKAPTKAIEEVESEDKTSPKLSKKVTDTSPKSARSAKTAAAAAAAAATAQKRNDSKERETKAKRSLSKEPEEVLKQIKTEPIDNSYEVTIEEVIASSMLVEPPIKIEGEESASESELKGRKLVRNPVAKRGLRNGKLRQLIPKVEPDAEQRRSFSMAEASVEPNLESARPLVVADSADPSPVNVKVEEPSDESSNHVGSDVAATPAADIETNNNGCENSTEEIGPTLRSKTKARNSDSNSDVRSVDGDSVKAEDSATNKPATAPFKSSEAGETGKKPAAKLATDMKAASASAPKSRRSSLELRRGPLYGSGGERLTPDGLMIDEMIDKIKLNIVKSIESKIFKPDSKGLLLGKSFEVPKIEDIVAPLSSDATTPKLDKEVDEEKPNVSKSKELNTGNLTKKEKSEDAENTVPKVADTAKEIEKLVMGDIEQADSQPPKDKGEQSANDAEDKTKTIAAKEDEQDDRSSLQSTSTENLDDSTGKDSTKSDETKKSVAPTRKSTRVTAGKSSSTLENKKSMSTQDICKELEKLDADEKVSDKDKNVDGTVKIKEEVSSKASSECDENKTVPATEDSKAAKNCKLPSSETKIDNEKIDIDESVDTEKNEETLESLSRDVERLVEEDNENPKEEAPESVENDVSSDVEMRLMIDEDVPESVSENTESNCPQPQTKDNNDGCDQKSFTESSDGVQKVETTVEPTSDVQEKSESEATTTANSATTDEKSKDAVKAKSTEVEEVERQKENRRVLRARGDKQKKTETTKSTVTAPITQEKSETKTIKLEDAANSEVPLNIQDSTEASNNSNQNQPTENEIIEPAPVIKIEKNDEQPEPKIRTRRSREVKRQPPPQVHKKRGPKKQETKKVEQQQNKEETMLDNEVAKINENDKSSTYLKADENRGVSANAGNAEQQKLDVPEAKNRSKSENDVRSINSSNDVLKSKKSTIISEETESVDTVTKEANVKDSDEASTSGESSSSGEKIYESPEERAKKEDILRQLGLESWERVKARENAIKEQQYTGTLKTVIRLQKEKDGKKRSRSPLKMVLKQQGRMDGEESFDYYTIQKEFGTSGLGESSTGANRKLSTNPRHSCDEDNEDAPLKDRQSLVIPEKSSSFSIHPGRLCADNCCYCHGKFGSLDTPMHLAQMKSDERKKKILENEVHLTKDSCLCDACYRHVDRKANSSPTNMHLKPQRQNRQSIIVCMARNCSESGKHHIKRRWLLKIKPNLRNLVDINWESNQHNLMTFCSLHYSTIERFLTCTLCYRRLTRNYTYPLGLTAAATEELNNRLRQHGIPATMVVNTFICRLCKYFTKLHVKNADFETMSDNNKDFHRKYRKKLLYCHDIDVPDSEDEEVDFPSQNSKNKDKNRPMANANKKAKYNTSDIKMPGSSKSPDNLESNSEKSSHSEKSSPEPPKTETGESETNTKEETNTSTVSESRFLGLEDAIEKLKKRKALDTSTTSSRSLLNSTNESTNNGSTRDIVEILAMDKEVTLTRLPKRPRLSNTATPSNDITPVVQRLGANPSISVRTLFPGEEEMNLHANVEFSNVREVTPRGWEKCATIIQYDRDTKLLWQELQRPYGNQSSFLRHLILLEKYYRSGDLILAPNASRNAINYSTSVQNRLISYEGPEKVHESTIEPINAIEYNNSRRLSGGYVLEREPRPSTSSSTTTSSLASNVTSQLAKLDASTRVMKLTPGVSIIKKPPPPNLKRLNMSSGGLNGSAKRKETIPIQKGSHASGSMKTTGGKVFQLSEPEFKKLQNLKRQKQMMNERHATSSPNSGSGSSNSPPTSASYKTSSSLAAQYQKAQQLAAQSQFQKHLRMQQEMLNQRSRGDFEPLICDIRTLANENTPTQNLINNLNLPKSIQVTTKAPVASSTPIPILPKIPKSLTVIPQTVSRAQDK